MKIKFTADPDKSTPERMINYLKVGATPETEKICTDYLTNFMACITGDSEELTNAIIQKIDNLSVSTKMKIWLASKITEVYLTQGMFILKIKGKI